MNDATQSGNSSADNKKTPQAFTADERAAMKERAKEVRGAARRSQRPTKEDDENEVLAKIAEMRESDRAIAERLHSVITANAPTLSPKLWYGMPAYARDGKLICFFQPAQKFKTRYATLGFNDSAHLDDGALWPVAYALTAVTAAAEARLAALVKQAVS